VSFSAGVPFDEKRHEVAYRALVKSRVRLPNDTSNLIWRELRILADQALLNFGDQRLLAGLGHLDSLRPARKTANSTHC
jgi:hypothetical protein